jgi:hypothetical protein
MIRAECHSDDFCVEVDFDATQWFEQASDDEIKALRDCDWGGDYPADEVAMFMAEHSQEVEDMFKYITLRHKLEHIGFECHVNPEDAERWLNDRSN